MYDRLSHRIFGGDWTTWDDRGVIGIFGHAASFSLFVPPDAFAIGFAALIGVVLGLTVVVAHRVGVLTTDAARFVGTAGVLWIAVGVAGGFLWSGVAAAV